jgi:protein transport protein SEC31
MEDGGVGFWRASRIIQKASPAECQIDLKTDAHSGPVRGLEVNPVQPFLVASGSVDAQIMLWDLNGLGEGFAPAANKSSRLEDVTDLAWNRKVAHILATASSNGYTVVWDLKVRKEVMQLALPGGRKAVSAIAWDPENPTHLLTATDDDTTPLIYSWDLRNAHAPNMVRSAACSWMCVLTGRLFRRCRATPRASCRCRGARRTRSSC